MVREFFGQRIMRQRGHEAKPRVFLSHLGEGSEGVALAHEGEFCFTARLSKAMNEHGQGEHPTVFVKTAVIDQAKGWAWNIHRLECLEVHPCRQDVDVAGPNAQALSHELSVRLGHHGSCLDSSVAQTAPCPFPCLPLEPAQQPSVCWR